MGFAYPTLLPYYASHRTVALGLSRKVLVDGYARVCFRQAVPLDNADLVGRIHFCCRMAILKGALG